MIIDLESKIQELNEEYDKLTFSFENAKKVYNLIEENNRFKNICIARNKLLEFYKPVLSSDIIQLYFFGGGTPSLMSPETMRDIFDCIPNFKENSYHVG